jgi:hypothetical protein
MATIDDLIAKVNVLDTSTNALLTAVNTIKTGLTATVAGSANSASASAVSAAASNVSASASNTRANESAASATASEVSSAAALANKNTAVTKATEALASKLAADADAASALANKNATDTNAASALANKNATDTNAASALSNSTIASTKAAEALASATAANTSAGAGAGSAASALAIYGTTNAMNAALTTAAAQNQLAQTAAASAGSVLQQDLSAISAALHRSPNAVTAQFIYDLSKDSDSGAWVDRMQHTSWMNESLCGAWLTGGFASELLARGDNLYTHAEQFDNAVYSLLNATVFPNAVTAPDGTYTADKLIENTALGVHNISRVTATGAGTVYMDTIYLKAAERSVVRIFTNYSGSGDSVIDLITGVITNGTANNYTAQSVGNGWFKVSRLFTSTGGNTAQYNLRQSSSVENYTGDGISGVYVWGAKLNQVGVLPSTYQASPELVSNGGFDNGTVGWAVESTGTASVVAGKLVLLSGPGTNDTIYQSIPTVVGKTYSISVDVISAPQNMLVAAGATTVIPVSTATGTRTGVFTATATTTLIIVRGGGALSNITLDNISVKEVTTLATPYVPYSSQTNSYYQSSADGKFYKLGATYGTLVEVFRGNKAKFPRLAAIVAEASSITIYDLTEAGRPMFCRFVQGIVAYATCNVILNSSIAGVVALNGVIAIADSNVSDGRLVLINFLTENITTQQSASAFCGVFNGGIAKRNTAVGYRLGVGNAIISKVVNAVAMTVLPDAVFDPITGLQTPTIAAFTAGGISVIQDNGTVVNSSSATAFTKGKIDADGVMGINSTGALVSAKPRGLAAAFAMTTYSPSTSPALMGVPTVMA